MQLRVGFRAGEGSCTADHHRGVRGPCRHHHLCLPNESTQWFTLHVPQKTNPNQRSLKSWGWPSPSATTSTLILQPPLTRTLQQKTLLFGLGFMSELRKALQRPKFNSLLLLNGDMPASVPCNPSVCLKPPPALVCSTVNELSAPEWLKNQACKIEKKEELFYWFRTHLWEERGARGSQSLLSTC